MTEFTLYPFPAEADRIDPFDTTIAEPQFVVLGGRVMTYAYRVPGGSAPAEFGLGELPGVIPMGYKILRYAQKLAVAEGGRISREWPRTVDLRDGMSPSVQAWLDRVCGHVVVNGWGRAVDLDDPYDDRLARATARDASLPDGRAVLLFVFDARDWH